MIAVITDSTSYLPAGWAANLGIEVVPVQVVIDGVAYDESDDDQAADVTSALLAMRQVTTSRPTPERFTRAIEDAFRAGATGVVVVTLSAAMSSTFESAQIAAADVAMPIRVLDSGTIAMGLGFGVRAGARLARAGAALDGVSAEIAAVCAATQVTFVVDSLEYLRRGGRIGATRAAVGHALQVKPMLAVRDGMVVDVDRVRTFTRALTALRERVRSAVTGDGGGAAVAVQYIGHPERAEQLASMVSADLPGADVIVCPVGGVLGAHVGPGMVATVVSPLG